MKRKASPPTLPVRITSLCRDGRGRGVATLAAELQVPEHAIRSALGELLQRKAIICTASTVNRGQGSHAVMLYSLPVVVPAEKPAAKPVAKPITAAQPTEQPLGVPGNPLCPLCNGGTHKSGRNYQGQQRYRCKACNHSFAPVKGAKRWTARRRAAYNESRQRM